MSTKYKFVQTTGCTAFDFTVNGESIADLSEEKQNEIIDYLLLKLKEEYTQGTILITNIVELFHYDDYEHDDYECGSCGDTVSTTTWNI